MSIFCMQVQSKKRPSFGSKIISVFKRRVSVMEITEPRHNVGVAVAVGKNGAPSLSGSIQSVQDQHPSSPWSPCFRQGSSSDSIDGILARGFLTGYERPTSDTPEDMHFHVPVRPSPYMSTILYSAPAAHQLSEDTVTVFSERESRSSVVLTVTPKTETFKGDVVSEHPAIVDNPPPFARHSEPPVRGSGPVQHSALQRRDSALGLEKQCSAMDMEREKLADRLEVTTQELAEAHDQLNQAKVELSIHQDRCAELYRRHHLWEDQYRTLAEQLCSSEAQLARVRIEHAQCAERNRTKSLRMKALSKSKSKSRRELKDRIVELGHALSDANDDVKRQSDMAAAADAKRFTMASDLERVTQQRDSALSELAVQQEQLEASKQLLTEQADADEDLQIAQREAYTLHQRMHALSTELLEARRELENEKVESAMVKQGSVHQGHEIRCLRRRLADVRGARRTA